jgi:gamma-glutamyltranspeptidase/glutathione hydrolase
MRRAISMAARWRQGGVPDAAALLGQPLPGGTLPPLPASTTFATVDRKGGAVVCALTMNNLFGTGRIAPGTGMLLAASPAAVPPPLLAAGLVYNTELPAFRALAGGSGQEGAAFAAADALAQVLSQDRRFAPPAPVPDPGRANVIACGRYLPTDDNSCGWAVDPRGAGLAIGSN